MNNLLSVEDVVGFDEFKRRRAHRRNCPATNDRSNGRSDPSASCSSVPDTNTPPSPPPPSAGLGPLRYDYVDPEEAAREHRHWPAHCRRLNHFIRVNLWAICKGHWESVLFVTATFAPENGVPVDTLYAERRLNQARPQLDRLFLCWFFVLEVDDNGVPHFHGVAIARGDIRRSWNQTAWQKMQRGETVGEH